MRELLSEWLTAAGYSFRESASGEDSAGDADLVISTCTCRGKRGPKSSVRCSRRIPVRLSSRFGSVPSRPQRLFASSPRPWRAPTHREAFYAPGPAHCCERGNRLEAVRPVPSGRARLRRRVIVVGTMLILAFTCSSAYDVWRAYQEAISATTRELTTLSTALAEEAARTFESLNLMLRETAAWYANNGNGVSAEVAHDRLGAYASGLPLLALGVHDSRRDPHSCTRNGDSRRTTQAPAPALARIRRTGHWRPPARPRAVVLIRGIAADGRLSGTVIALIDLGDFREF